MSWTVALTDIVVSDEDVEAVLDCLRGGWLTMGPRTRELELGFAQLVGSPHAVAVSSGTAALHLALLAAGIGPGDEVLVPDVTFVAGAAAARYCGATPVMVDSVGVHDLNIDPACARALVSSRTRAILTTHWMGYACALRELEQICDEHGLALIEDCAHSVTAVDAEGRQTGTVGAAGCFSFFSKKQLCCGEGGMVVTADGELAARIRSLRSHTMTSGTWDRHKGHAESYDVTGVGFNFRIDEPRAALALSRMARLLDDVERRRTLVREYRRRLGGLPGLTIPWDEQEVARASHFGFVVLLESSAERDRVSSELAARGVQTTWYPALSALSEYRGAHGGTNARLISKRNLVLPLASTYTVAHVETVTELVRDILADR